MPNRDDSMGEGGMSRLHDERREDRGRPSRDDPRQRVFVELGPITVNVVMPPQAMPAWAARMERKLDALILQGPELEALKASIGGLDQAVDGLEGAIDSQQAQPDKG